ncbi:MAG: thermonuclease family protein [bacterium]
MSERIVILLVLLIALAGACRDPGGDPPEPDAAIDAEVVTFDHPARVLQIRDGDTIEVRFLDTEVSVRLLGVDTPELGPPVEPYAAEAKLFTTQYASPGTTVGLEFDDEACGVIPFPTTCFDLYDRMLAYVRTPEGYDLNALLLANGLARVYDAATFDRKDAYLQTQSQAQSQGIGLWSQ